MADLKSILLTVTTYAVYAFILRCVIVYSYRALLHPLHSYPGPFLAKLTDWYGAYHALWQDGHEETYKNHRKYGPVFRQGPNRLLFSSTRAVQDIYHSDRLFKSKAYLVVQPKKDVFNTFNTLDKKAHRFKRRIIGQGINEKAMRDFEPSMLFHVDRFICEVIRISRLGKPINITNRCRYLGMDVVGELGFGTDLRLQIDEKNRFMLPGMDTSNFRSNLYFQFPPLKKWGMEIFMYPVIFTSQLKYYVMIRNLILERRKKDLHAKHDLFSSVSDIKDPDTGEKMRLRDIWSEAAFFIPAGGDTIATNLTALFYWLSTYPECYKRLAAEIRSAFTSASEIRNGSKLLSLPYLRACIDEALRITPPIPTQLWRDLPKSAPDAAEPLVIDGHVIPAGTEVAVNLWAIHHDEKCFPEPWKYKPERWLHDESPAHERKIAYDSFNPFSIGPRGCAGKAMAYLETSLVMAKVFWYLDFKMSDADLQSAAKQQGFRVKDRFGALHNGPSMIFNVRGEQWREMLEEN